MASGSQHGLSFIAEVTRGTTPTTPTMVNCRHTSCSLGLTKDTFQSEELRTDRQIVDIVAGGYRIGGEIGVEFSYGSHDALLEAALGGTWNTNVLKAGTTRRYFTFERLFGDIGSAGKPYHRFRGCEVNGFSLSAKANSKVTGSFSVVGKDLALDTAIITGETYAAATTTVTFNSFTGTINEGGSASAIISELSFSLNNGIEPRFVVGAAASASTTWGRSNITGSVTAEFENSTLLEKFINETASSIEITLTDAAGNDLTFKLGRVEYTGGQVDVSGEGAITIALPFQATYLTGDASNIVITRAAA